MPTYSPLLRTVLGADGRHLTAEEREHVLEFAASLPARAEAARLLEEKEAEIVDACLAEVRRRYPNLPAAHERAWEKGKRDLTAVLRYTAQGMLLDDLEVASERLFFWFRSINAALGMTPRFSRDSYTALREAARRKLPEDAFALLRPHLDRAVEVLSDHAEPMNPAV